MAASFSHEAASVLPQVALEVDQLDHLELRST
jgi:hypothetical protein